ncbi:MAG: C39 family peptidase [Cellulosilyticaceae bacterium]
MINLEPMHSNIWDCYDDCVCTICGGLRINAMHIFASTWNFYMLPEEGKLIGYLEDQKELKRHALKRYVGITMIQGELESINSLKKMVRRGNPVIIEIEMENLAWSASYQKTQLQHACIVVGYDATKRAFQIVDPSNMRKNVWLEEKILKKPMKYEVFDGVRGRKQVATKQIIEGALSAYHQYAQTGNGFEDMRLYAKRIVPEILERKILEKYSNTLLECEAFLHILEISRGRLTFAQWLEDVGEREGHRELVAIAQYLQKIGLKWQNLRMKLMEGVCRKTLYLLQEEIGSDIEELLRQEQQVYELLEVFCGKKQVVECEDVFICNKLRDKGMAV